MSIMENLENLKSKNIWVNRFLSSREKGEEISEEHNKAPINPNNIKQFAKVSDDETWGTFHQAVSNRKNDSRLGVGIVLPPNRTLVGIDFDNILHEEDKYKIIREDVVRFIDRLKSYTEISPSGRGLHVIVEMDEKDSIVLQANKKHHSDGTVFEIYNNGRYLTFTEDIFVPADVRKVSSMEMFEALNLIGYPWKQQFLVSNHRLATVRSNNFSDEEVLALCYKHTWFGYYYTFSQEPKVKQSHSEADVAILKLLGYYSASIKQTERLWRNCWLGRREKVVSRADYVSRTLHEAFRNLTEFYRPHKPASLEDGERPQITIEEYQQIVDSYMDIKSQETNKATGKVEFRPYKNDYNVHKLLTYAGRYQGMFWYNEFSKEYMVGDKALDDDVLSEIIVDIQHQGVKDFANITPLAVERAIKLACRDNMYHPLRDWLNNLKWDGQSRLHDWIDIVCGAPQNYPDQLKEYRQQVGQLVLKGMVGRVFNPGCKFDYALVLEGPQGCGKSTLLSLLAGKEYKSETQMATNQRDMVVNTLGDWIVEFSEGETLKNSSYHSIKQYITNEVDKIRLPYGRKRVDIYRQFIIAITTNETEYLSDPTGNRRFMPIEMYNDFIDIEWFTENREQLFAEAVHLYLEDPSLELETSYAEIEQQKRKYRNNWDEEIDNYITSLDILKLEEGVTVKEIYEKTALSDMTKLSARLSQYIGSRLKTIYKMRQTRIRVMNKTTRVYYKPVDVSSSLFNK